MSIPEILDELKRLLPGDVPPVMAISYGCQIARCGMYGAHPVHKMEQWIVKGKPELARKCLYCPKVKGS